MAFELATEDEVPTHNTVASYTVYRLGLVPSIKIRYADTVEDGVNPFGITAQKQTINGRVWELIFDADKPEKVQAMGELITNVMMSIGRALLTALGIPIETVTDEQLLAAVTAMDNVDSFIASAFEQLELNRRIGQGPELIVMGPAPAVHIP